MDIWEKLKVLKEKYPDEESAGMISTYDQMLRKAMVVGSLQDHDGFKLLVGKYAGEIAQIKEALGTNEAFFKNEEGIMLGRLMHERRKWCEDFLRFFDSATHTRVGIENSIERKLSE